MRFNGYGLTAWLYNVIDKNLHSFVAYASMARAIWIDLKERHSNANAIWVHQLKREMALVAQENLTMTEHFTKLKAL